MLIALLFTGVYYNKLQFETMLVLADSSFRNGILREFLADGLKLCLTYYFTYLLKASEEDVFENISAF